MAVLTNSFETGLAAGTAITVGNSGDSQAGNPFTLFSDTAGATCVYSDTGMAHGTRCMHVTTGATSGPSRRGWSVNAALTTAAQFFRFYVNTATVVGSPSVLRGMNVGSTGQRFRVSVSAAGVVTLFDKNNVAVWTSAALPAGNWRIELSLEGQDARPYQVLIFAADSQTPTQDSGVQTGDFGGPISEVWFGQTNSASNVAVKLDDVGWSDTAWLGPAISLPTVTHAWVGALTDTQATVSYGLEHVTNARLVVSTQADLSSPVYSPAGAVDADGFVKLTRTGLAPNTAYHFGIEADGTLLTAGRGTFTTDPAPMSQFSFSVAFGSCNQTNSNSETWQAIAERVGPYGPARRMLHEGDIHYRDFGAGTTKADVLAQWRSTLGPTRMRQLLRTIPTAYIWDNHDWGGPDSDSRAPAGSVIAQAYRQVVPHYPLATTGSKGIWQSFPIGRVRFIMLDTRSQRTPRTDPEGSGPLNPNPTFDGGDAGWYTVGATRVWSPDQGREGTGALFVTPDGVEKLPRAEHHAVAVAGKVVAGSGWIRPTTANKRVRIAVHAFDAAGAYLLTRGFTQKDPVAGTLMYLETGRVSFEDVPDAARYSVVLGLEDTGGTPAAPTDTFHVDQAELRTPPKTLLGPEQKEWFYNQLSQPEPVKIIVCGIYWRHDSANGDRWGSYGGEFQEIRQWIQARPDVKAFVIFGDRHALAADNGSSPACYLPQAGGAPFDQGSTESFEPWSHGYYATPGTNLKAFGWLDITDAGSSITVAYSGITSLDGQTRVSMSVDFPAAATVPARWGIHV